MVCYPEVQKEAQAELDKVLNGRLPEHRDFPSLPYLLALVLKKFFGILQHLFFFRNSFFYAKHVSAASRLEPVGPIGRLLLLYFIIIFLITSWWLPCFVKASHTSWSPMISTTSIIFLPTLLWFPTNGDSHLPLLIFELSSFLKLYSIGWCWMTNRSIQNRMNSSPSTSWRMENSTVQLETWWTLHLVSAGGEHHLFFPYLVRCHHSSGRICPAKHIAHLTLTLAAASVLLTFDLVRKVDKNGQEIDPKREYTGSAIW